VHYCRVRHAAEVNELASISVADISRYRPLRPLFSSRHYADLFQRHVANSERSRFLPDISSDPNMDCVLRLHPPTHLL